MRRKLSFTSCGFLTRIAAIFIGREEEEHSGITTDIKKILLGYNFLFLVVRDGILLKLPWFAGLSLMRLFNWPVLEGVPGIGRRFLWNSVHM